MAAEHAEALAQAWAEVCRDERVDTAAQILHNRRHLLGTANTCERCTADARAVAVVFLTGEVDQ